MQQTNVWNSEEKASVLKGLMKNCFYALLFASILISCKTNNFVGLYGECEHGFLACNQLEIRSDSTFTYFEYWDVGGVENIIDGNWFNSGDTLFLTSRIQQEPCNIELVPFDDGENGQNTILLLDQNEQAIPLSLIIMYSDGKVSGVETDFDGRAFIKNLKEIDSIGIRSYDYFPYCENYFVTTQNLDHQNDLKLRVSYSHVNISMLNEPWLFKDDRAYFHQDSTGKFDREIFKTKTSVKNKVF